MYADTDVMRRRADQLREQAVDIRALADQLVAQTESTGWHGRAATSMRERVTERAAHLRDVAARHETAADSMDRHVQEADGVAEAIAARERRAAGLVAEARARVQAVEREAEADLAGGSGARREPDPDDVVLAGFSGPPSGHRDWLDVELPGL